MLTEEEAKIRVRNTLRLCIDAALDSSAPHAQITPCEPCLVKAIRDAYQDGYNAGAGTME